MNEQQARYVRNTRMQCRLCGGWMRGGEPTEKTPLKRARSPFAHLCTGCLEKCQTALNDPSKQLILGHRNIGKSRIQAILNGTAFVSRPLEIVLPKREDW